MYIGYVYRTFRIILRETEREFHDFLTLLTSTEKLLTRLGFKLALASGTLVRRSTSWAIELFLSDEGPMLETFDYTIRIGSTPTFLYFDW